MGSAILSVLAGALGWTFLEYILHRFVFHGPSTKRPGAGEHRKHHALGDYFAPWQQKALAAALVTALLLPATSLLFGVREGLLGTLGFVSMYLLYEVLHRRAHTRPPRSRYGRWRRKHHFAHHFVDPRRAHGVTSPIWDRVFGTELEVERVRVPRRLAMPWLVDAGGNIYPAYASDYVLMGSDRGGKQTRQRDRATSLANERPAD